MKRQVARSKTCLRLIDGLNGHPPERQRRGLLQPPAEPFDAVVARSEAVLALQVLPDPLDGQAAFQGGNDGLPERLTPTRRPRRPGGRVWPVLLAGQVAGNDLGARGPGQVRPVLVARPGGQVWPVLARAVVAAGTVTRAVLRELDIAGYGLAVNAQLASNPPLRPAAGV
jgi:hypothetical protein